MRRQTKKGASMRKTGTPGYLRSTKAAKQKARYVGNGDGWCGCHVVGKPHSHPICLSIFYRKLPAAAPPAAPGATLSQSRRTAKRKATVPKAPSFASGSRRQAGQPRKSSTTLELERIQREKEQIKARRARNKRRLEALATHHATVTKKKPTRAVAPAFRSAARAAARAPATAPSDNTAATTTTTTTTTAAAAAGATSRSNVSYANRKPTKPQPFSFATSKRVSKPDGTARETYVPVAEAIHRMQTRAPGRFHSKPKHHKPASATGGARRQLRPTKPMPFSFTSKPRAAAAGPTTEEREVARIRAMPKFKARPFSARVRDSAGDVGVRRQPKRKPTVPVAPSMTIEQRIQERAAARAAAAHTDGGDVGAAFVARPMPDFSGGGPIGHQRSTARLTIAASPMLATRGRARAPLAAAARPPQPPQFKAQPVPASVTGAPQTLSRPPAAPATVPQPFNLASNERIARAQNKRQEAQAAQAAAAERARVFKARGVGEGVDAGAGTFPVEHKQPTVPAPFQLASVARHERSVAVRRRQQQSREQQKAAMRRFRARAIPAEVSGVGHRLRPNQHRAVRPGNVQLASDRRAAARARFDRSVAARMQLEAEEKEKEAAAAAATEAAEVQRLRRGQMSFKARPIMRGCRRNMAAHSPVAASRPVGAAPDAADEANPESESEEDEGVGDAAEHVATPSAPTSPTQRMSASSPRSASSPFSDRMMGGGRRSKRVLRRRAAAAAAGTGL